jgi:iron complex transport system substrate-binding protein
MDIEFIADLTGTELQGKALISQINTDVADIKERVEEDKPEIEGGHEPYVYLEVSDKPDIYVAGDNTFIASAIGDAGGQVAFAGETGWLIKTPEDIVQMAEGSVGPDYIFSTVRYDGYDINEMYNREGWDIIPAIKNKRVYSLDPDSIMRPSQNITKGIFNMAKIMHPNTFSDVTSIEDLRAKS